jgi:superfamily II DNA or RNA helicase
MGIRPPAFKVFRDGKSGSMYIPRFYGDPAVTDRRVEPVPANITFVGKLRDATRQNEAFAAGVNAFREVGGGVLSLPPGFGKTTMALAYAAHLKVRTMIIVHKEFLANQWKDRIRQFCPGATIGRVQQDTFDVECDFVIAMIQTLCSRENDPKAFDSIGLVIVDEAHHIGAAAFSQTMFKLCPRYALGLTATPERKDGLTNILYWFLGPEFFGVKRENQKTTQVETVFFDDPLFREAPPVSRFGKINMAGMVTQLTEIDARNDKILDLVRGLDPSRRVLLLSDRREHCFWLRNHIEGAAVYLGGMSEKDLDEASKHRVIVATYSMAQEGLDIPVLDTLVMTTPHSDVTQAVGRIMRETPGKVNAPLIIDIVDRWSVFNSMYRKRCVIYKASGFSGTDEKQQAQSACWGNSAQEFPKGKCLL